MPSKYPKQTWVPPQSKILSAAPPSSPHPLFNALCTDYGQKCRLRAYVSPYPHPCEGRGRVRQSSSVGKSSDVTPPRHYPPGHGSPVFTVIVWASCYTQISYVIIENFPHRSPLNYEDEELRSAVVGRGGLAWSQAHADESHVHHFWCFLRFH